MRGAKRVGASARGGCCHAPLSNDTTRRREEDACCLIVYKVTIKVNPIYYCCAPAITYYDFFFITTHYSIIYCCAVAGGGLVASVTAYSLSSPPWHVFRNGNENTCRRKQTPTFILSWTRRTIHLPKEVELTEENDALPEKSKKPEQEIVDVEITFWTHVGWDGVLVILFSLGIAGLFVYIVYLYTKSFKHGIGPACGYLWCLRCCTNH